MSPRNRGEIQGVPRRGQVQSIEGFDGGIDRRDIKIQRMGDEANSRPIDIRRNLLDAVNKKRMVGSVGSAQLVARGVTVPMFQWKEEDERVVSINLVHDINYTTFNNPLASSRATAIIAYGAGGGQTEIEVDVRRSCSFSLLAGFVLCSIRNDSSAVAASDMPVRAWLTDRGVPNPLPPTKTLFHGAIAPAGTQAFGVPKCAQRVRYVRAPSTASVMIYMYDFGAGEFVEVPVGAGGDSGTLDLPMDCTAVIIENTSAVALTRGRLIFELNV